MSQKKYYIDVINILAPINVFAGGLTIAAQFITPCSEFTLANLLALASELFLASLAGLVVVFLLLYGFWDTDVISNGPKPAQCYCMKLGRHSFVVVQIVIVGTTMIMAFFVLGVAIIVIGDHWARGIGMGLVILVFVGAVAIGVMIGTNEFVRVTGSLAGPPDPVPIHDVERDFTTKQGVSIAFFLLFESLVIVVLLGIGIWQAIGPPGLLCDPSPLSPQWPPSTLAMSEANSQTNILATFTDSNTVLSITLTEINTIVSRSWSRSTRCHIATTTTTTVAETSLTTTVSVAVISTIFKESYLLSNSVPLDTTPSPPLSPEPAESLNSLTYTSFDTTWTFVTSTVTSTIPCRT